MNILLIKPYQPCTNYVVSPPLGILYLVSQLRNAFAGQIHLRIIDAKLERRSARDLTDDLDWADLVGLSVLNYEAVEAFKIARLAKLLGRNKLVALGGPYAHHQAKYILAHHDIDWVFDGESDRSFIEAVRVSLEARKLDGSILGMYFRQDENIVTPPQNDFIEDLDSLPFPAWDLIDFDKYARAPNMNGWMMGKRYATIFTSRGCPYKCSYCHDIFTKKFRCRSATDVVQEIELLANKYTVDEFQIVDDIFNLHKPRLKSIFRLIGEQFGPKAFYFCFPNGLRGDIISRDIIDSLRDGGAYQITVAVETVTARLQKLIEKNLDVAKVDALIRYCHNSGIIAKGYFMLGFPTETRAELWNTIRFAWHSKLLFASFFTVVPQPGTPLYSLAREEGSEALDALSPDGYYNKASWYQRAYGSPIWLWTIIAYLGFYCRPWRIWQFAHRLNFRQAFRGVTALISILSSIDFFAIADSWQRIYRSIRCKMKSDNEHNLSQR